MRSHGTDPSITVWIALGLWIPLGLLIFATFTRHVKALLIAMVGGWLFLPCYVLKLKAIRNFLKLTAAAHATRGIPFGTLLFDYSPWVLQLQV